MCKNQFFFSYSDFWSLTENVALLLNDWYNRREAKIKVQEYTDTCGGDGPKTLHRKYNAGWLAQSGLRFDARPKLKRSLIDNALLSTKPSHDKGIRVNCFDTLFVLMPASLFLWNPWPHRMSGIFYACKPYYMMWVVQPVFQNTTAQTFFMPSGDIAASYLVQLPELFHIVKWKVWQKFGLTWILDYARTCSENRLHQHAQGSQHHQWTRVKRILWRHGLHCVNWGTDVYPRTP